jgi:hypothetical protein
LNVLLTLQKLERLSRRDRFGSLTRFWKTNDHLTLGSASEVMSKVRLEIGSGASDQPIFCLRENGSDDGGPGRDITFTGADIRPLGYAELAGAKLHQNLTMELEWRNVKLVAASDLEASRSYTVRATLESSLTLQTVALVSGGWLPPAFASAIPSATILADRNVVSQIVSRFENGTATRAESDFLDLLAGRSVRINPLLFAMEGNAKKIPTPELMKSQLEEAMKKLRAALPAAHLVVGPDSLRGALGIIEESRQGFERKQKFLLRIVPRLAAPVSQRKMRARWDEVLAAADDCSVPRGSLVLLAALSSILVQKGRSPARGLLKLRADYHEELAYNALVDLRSLELLIYMLALFPEHGTTLLTADKDLALFWTGIRASNFEWDGAAATVNFSPVQELLGNSKLDDWQFGPAIS